MFHIKLPDLRTRQAMIAHLRADEIMAVFHYVPFHSSPMGKKVGTFVGADRYTTSESERILRLPMFYGLQKNDQNRVIDSIAQFKH